jgi:hypothetical protein
MSIKYKKPESRIPQRRKPIECQYPKCKKEATHSLGMADPDAEKSYYCKEHCEEVKQIGRCRMIDKEIEISLCHSCFAMTKTIRGGSGYGTYYYCGKCKAIKQKKFGKNEVIK